MSDLVPVPLTLQECRTIAAALQFSEAALRDPRGRVGETSPGELDALVELRELFSSALASREATQ